MKITTFEEFREQYSSNFHPVTAEILGDMDTPVSTFLKATNGKFRFLLESVEGGVQRGRYSIIGDSPLVIFTCKNNVTDIEYVYSGEKETFTENPFQVLKNLYKQYKSNSSHQIPFIDNGFFGYMGYDSIRYIEKLPDQTIDDMELPDIQLFIPQKVIVFDNLFNTITIIYNVVTKGNVEKEYAEAVNKIKDIIDSIHSSPEFRNGRTSLLKSDYFESNISKEEYKKIVEKTKEYIKKGDIFQGVLSQRLRVSTDTNPFDIYRALRVINPSPYMFYLDMDNTSILGSSPETLVKLEDGKVLVKPIAGTRKRGLNEQEDKEIINELLADPKERAEHTMLVDLGRNDIGRIAEYGSVKVEDLMITEKYSHVIHIVSTVSGKLKEGMDAIDVFKACFPAGTVSGAPKVRAMEIIEELEPTKRGIYAGAAGYFGFNGNMDVCIAIRTIYIKDNNAYVQAGAGIVADSVPESEYQETLNKAKGLLTAIEYAQGGLL